MGKVLEYIFHNSECDMNILPLPPIICFSGNETFPLAQKCIPRGVYVLFQFCSCGSRRGDEKSGITILPAVSNATPWKYTLIGPFLKIGIPSPPFSVPPAMRPNVTCLPIWLPALQGRRATQMGKKGRTSDGWLKGFKAC